MKVLSLGFLLFLLSACASPTPVVGTGLLEIDDCVGPAAILVIDNQGHWELMAPDGSKALGNPTLPPDVAVKYLQKVAPSVPKTAGHRITVGDCTQS